MARQVNHSDEPEADLEKTDELQVLDVAAYEAQLVRDDPDGELTAPRVSDLTGDESRPRTLAEPPPAETLRDVEAWIAAQDARVRTYEHDLAHLQAARTDAQARADNLTLELEVAQRALRTALGRANDGERAALDNGAAARTAESRAAELQTKLGAAKQQLATATERVAAATAELARTHESLAASARGQDEMQQRQAALTRDLDERSNRMAQLEGELASLRAHIAEADRELAQRGERIAAIQRENEVQQAAADATAQERDALAMRVASLVENAQSREWTRSLGDSIWRELDVELTEARRLIARLEAERADFAATVKRVAAELAERDLALARLEHDRAAQLTALEELAASHSREQQERAVSAQELRVYGEKLATEIKALEERHQRSTEYVAAREAELAESRAACAALQVTLRTVQSSDSTHAARVAELEALAADLGEALRAQTEATHGANALLEARERELADEQARAGALQAELQAATLHATAQSAAAVSTEAALKMHLEQLAASQERLANSEQQATRQSERLADLQAELAHAKALAAQGEASRRPLESELARVRTELQRELERTSSLDAAQQKLTLELARTRGALDERELQLRRLERHATSSAQLLSRIRVGIERGTPNRRPETPEFPDDGATLIPLDDSDAPPLTLGRHTTIGRSRASDLCLTDTSISRRHAVLTIGPKGAFIEDLGSANGVTVNRQLLRHARLSDGDVIGLGLKRFRFTTPPARSVG
jgi:chromosome segregation ATPase